MVEDGKRRKAYALQMILGYSRMRFVAFTTRTDTASLTRLHLEAFESFGGFPKAVLCDNMFTVVIERGPDAQPRKWNDLFQDFFTTPGFRRHLCSPYASPDDRPDGGRPERGLAASCDPFYTGNRTPVRAASRTMDTSFERWANSASV